MIASEAPSARPGSWSERSSRPSSARRASSARPALDVSAATGRAVGGSAAQGDQGEEWRSDRHQPGQDAERAEQDAGDDERAEQATRMKRPGGRAARFFHLAPGAPLLRLLRGRERITLRRRKSSVS
jgi:hypothetical protein